MSPCHTSSASTRADDLERLDDVVLAVRPREDDDTDPGRHQRAPTPVADGVARSDGGDLDDGVLDDGVGEQPLAISAGPRPGRGLVGRLHREADGLAHPDGVDPVEAESGKGPFDGGALGIGDPGTQPHLDQDVESHRRITSSAPYQSASDRPLIRS